MPVAEEHMVRGSKTRINAHDRLIFALDVSSIERAKALVSALDGVVSFFKIGLELSMVEGVFDLIPQLTRAGKRVFLDLKYYDVPETVERAVRNVAGLGVSFLTVHGNGNIVKAAAEGRGDADLKLLTVTVLTSLDNDDMRDLGFKNVAVKDLVMHRAKKALEAGCDGVIASVKEAGDIRAMARAMDNKFLIVTPGIRTSRSHRDDHKRIGTPSDAIKAGADFLVVGRPIRDAADPRKEAEEIVAEMQAAFDSLTDGQ